MSDENKQIGAEFADVSKADSAVPVDAVPVTDGDAEQVTGGDSGIEITPNRHDVSVLRKYVCISCGLKQIFQSRKVPSACPACGGRFVCTDEKI